MRTGGWSAACAPPAIASGARKGATLHVTSKRVFMRASMRWPFSEMTGDVEVSNDGCEKADEKTIHRQAEIVVPINALTGPRFQGSSDVGTSIRAEATQLPARDVEQLVSARSSPRGRRLPF